MKLRRLTYKGLIGKMRDLNEELIERFQKDTKDNADEFTAINAIELGIDDLNRSLERQGKIK